MCRNWWIIVLYFSLSTAVKGWVTVPSLATRTKLSINSKLQMSTTLDQKCVNEVTQSKFRGHTVLLTGASGGLGKALALQLARCGVHTLVLSGRNKGALEAVAEETKGIYSDILTHTITCDLNDPASVSALSKEALEKCDGRIDVLVNNGGVSSRSRFLETSLEVDQKLMQINFMSGAALAKAVTPGMVERRHGYIIWISSVQGLFGLPNRTSYAASKFAVQGYCEAMRAELANSGISVHVASPGYIRTNLSRSAITGDGKLYGQMDKSTENGADPTDVAIDVLQNVAKNKADFIVAATLSAKAAIWLRFFSPSILNSMLVKRYEKSLKESS